MVGRTKKERDRWQVAQWDKNDKLICEIIEARARPWSPISVFDIMKSLKEKVKEDNKKTQRQFIHDHGGTDEGWKPERCISRQAVHTHLKQLVRALSDGSDGSDGRIIRTGRGAYSSKTASKIGKDLLGTHANLDLVAWFIGQLESYDVPAELLAKGRNLLKNYLLFLGGVYKMLDQFLIRELGNKLTLPIIMPVPETDGKVEGEQDQGSERLFNFDPSYKVKMPNLTIRIPGQAKPLSVGGTSISAQIFQETIADINPYMFNVTITACYLEMALRKLYEGVGKEAPGLFLYGDMLAGEGKESLQKTTNDIDRIAAWWGEVSDYIPSSGMFRFMTVVSINSTRTFKKALSKIAPDYHVEVQ